MNPRIHAELQECQNLIPFLKTISNTKRLGILCILMEGEHRVGEIQQLLGKKQSYVSQQLKYLKGAGYLKKRREGTQIYYRLVDDRVAEVIRYLIELFRESNSENSLD